MSYLRTFSSTAVKHFRPTVFRPSVPQQNVGIILTGVGFLTMAIGGRFIGRALSAGKKAATAELNPDGTEKIPEIDHSLNYYKGGFEEKMTSSEAALILGVRASACQEQIMDRYRLMIRINHPDLGGSPFIASKINEAKNLMFARARSDPEYLKSKKRRADREALKEKLKEASAVPDEIEIDLRKNK